MKIKKKSERAGEKKKKERKKESEWLIEIEMRKKKEGESEWKRGNKIGADEGNNHERAINQSKIGWVIEGRSISIRSFEVTSRRHKIDGKRISRKKMKIK